MPRSPELKRPRLTGAFQARPDSVVESILVDEEETAFYANSACAAIDQAFEALASMSTQREWERVVRARELGGSARGSRDSGQGSSRHSSLTSQTLAEESGVLTGRGRLRSFLRRSGEPEEEVLLRNLSRGSISSGTFSQTSPSGENQLLESLMAQKRKKLLERAKQIVADGRGPILAFPNVVKALLILLLGITLQLLLRLAIKASNPPKPEPQDFQALVETLDPRMLHHTHNPQK